MKELAQQLVHALEKYTCILIYIKGSPDPDAIASSLAIKYLCDSLNIKANIVAIKKLSLSQNKLFIRKLDIPVKITREIEKIDKYDAYIVVDHQSAMIDHITGVIPCAAHIDHHEKTDEHIPADFRLIRKDMGSTCTIISLLFRELNPQMSDAQRTNMATALLFGIQTDTDKYRHASRHDYEAINYLSRYADNAIINDIAGLPMSQNTAKYLSMASDRQIIYKNWLIYGIGFIDETDRDSIAIIADFLLSRENVSVVVVYASVIGRNGKSLTLDASFRTNNDNLNLNNIIKGITPDGGARKYKGAFQVPLDFLSVCPDRDMLWEVLNLSTLESLKQQRDEILITELKGFFTKVRGTIKGIFK